MRPRRAWPAGVALVIAAGVAFGGITWYRAYHDTGAPDDPPSYSDSAESSGELGFAPGGFEVQQTSAPGESGEPAGPVSGGFMLNDTVTNRLAMYAEQEEEQTRDCETGAGWKPPVDQDISISPGTKRLLQDAALRLDRLAYQGGNFVLSYYPVMDYLTAMAQGAAGLTASDMAAWLAGDGVRDGAPAYFGSLTEDMSAVRAMLDSQHEYRREGLFCTSRALKPSAKSRFRGLGLGVRIDDEPCGLEDVNQYFQIEENRIQFENGFGSDIALACSGMFETNWKECSDAYYQGEFAGSTAYYFKQAGTLLDLDGAKAVSVPFEYDGYEMLFIMPDGDLQGFLMDLDYETFVRMLGSRGSRTEAYIPKLAVESEYDISALLRLGGLASAFQDSQDFSLLCNGMFNLGEIRSRSYLALNARGARTWDTVAEVRPREDDMPGLWLDRPFLFFIIDSGTGLPVMSGGILDTGA